MERNIEPQHINKSRSSRSTEVLYTKIPEHHTLDKDIRFVYQDPKNDFVQPTFSSTDTELNRKIKEQKPQTENKRMPIAPPVGRRPPGKGCRTEHFARLGIYTENLRSDNLLTDITIKVDEYTFNAHRQVLACYSPLLKKKLTEHTSETVQLTGIKPSILRVLLNYMYTGELKVSCQTLSDVFYGARKLEMKDVMARCTEKLRGNSGDVRSYLYMYVAAEKLGMLDKRKQAFELIVKNFEDCIRTEEFLELNCDQMCEVLSGDPISARSEVVVFLAAMKWLDYNAESRVKHAVRVLSCIRFSLMSQRELLHCFHPPMAKHIVLIKEYHNMLLCALCYVTAKNFSMEDYFKDYESLPRKYSSIGELTELWDLGPVEDDAVQVWTSDLKTKWENYIKKTSQSLGKNGSTRKIC